MNKASVVLLAFVLLILFVTVPVMAEPTNGQKVPCTITFTSPHTIATGESHRTNGDVIQRRDYVVGFNVELDVYGASPIFGTAVVERDVGMANVPHNEMLLWHEKYVISFPTEEGGFEGTSLEHYSDFVSMSSYNLDIHFVLRGTGEFEGQTINAWRTGPAGPGGATGYLLKP